MWTAILGAVTAALGLLAKLIGGGSGDTDQRELGRAEQQNADSKDDMRIVRASTDAARQAEEESPDAQNDPNDRANRC